MAFILRPAALARGDLDLVITADPVDEAGIAYFPIFGYEANSQSRRITPW